MLSSQSSRVELSYVTVQRRKAQHVCLPIQPHQQRCIKPRPRAGQIVAASGWHSRYSATEKAAAVIDNDEYGLRRLPPDIATDSQVAKRLERYVSESLSSRLFPFQREGLRFGVKHQGRVMLADEMGLGKTVQAICIAACYPKDWPLLVVCPSSMRLVWYDALLQWLPRGRIPEEEDLIVIKSGKDIKKKLLPREQRPRRHIVIISYDLVQKLQGYENRFNFIICDESHMLKNHTTQRTKFIWPLVHDYRRAILIDMIIPGLLGTRNEFGTRYCGGYPTQIARNVYDWRGSSHLGELNAILQKHVLIRRLKKDVLQDLPPKLRQRVTIEVDPHSLKELTGIKIEMARIKRNEELSEANRKQLLEGQSMRYYQATGKAKLPGTLEQIETALNEGDKIIVFAHHQAVLDGVEAKFGKDGQSVRIDGRVSVDKRKLAVDAFQQDPQVKLAILSITAAGVGITLTAAQCVIFAELFWNPGHLIQAEDRAHRVGQKGSVQVRYLYAPASMDQVMWPLLTSKLAVVGQVLDGNAAGTAQGLHIAGDLLEADSLSEESADVSWQDFSASTADQATATFKPAKGAARKARAETDADLLEDNDSASEPASSHGFAAELDSDSDSEPSKLQIKLRQLGSGPSALRQLDELPRGISYEQLLEAIRIDETRMEAKATKALSKRSQLDMRKASKLAGEWSEDEGLETGTASELRQAVKPASLAHRKKAAAVVGTGRRKALISRDESYVQQQSSGDAVSTNAEASSGKSLLQAHAKRRQAKSK